MTEQAYDGGCMCGALRYRAEGSPKRVGICHCLTCRRNTGAPYGGDVGRYASSEQIDRCFCRSCGAPVFSEEGGEVNVYYGSLDDPGDLRPSYQLWSARRLPWVPEMPDLDAFERDRD
jgi:hypothetical protein